jgi:hypothetical protein
MVMGTDEEEAIVVATLPARGQVTEKEQSENQAPPGAVREVLEALRSHYQERLHRRSDDFAATQELQSVERALAALPRE